MSAGEQGTLTEKVRAIQARNQQFQHALTNAGMQALFDPNAALASLNECWSEADSLEEEELAFLQQSGDWGFQQMPQAKNSWSENRLQILIGKAQTLLVLARFEEAKSAIESARSYITDPQHMAASMLDQLEIAVLEAQA
jgi:hypothetical protein